MITLAPAEQPVLCYRKIWEKFWENEKLEMDQMLCFKICNYLIFYFSSNNFNKK